MSESGTPTAGGPPPPPPSTAPPPPPGASGPSRLTRSRGDRVIGGVCGGIAQHLSIDPVIVRLAFVVLVLAGGSGIVAYLIAWIVIPEEPVAAAGAVSAPAPARPPGSGSLVAGIALIGIGGALLVERLFPAFSWRFVAPAALILLGVVLLVRRGDR